MISNFLSIFGMISAGITFVLAARLRLGRVWGSLVAGASLWLVAIALKFTWAGATNYAVASFIVAGIGPPAGAVVFWIYVGLLTGIFECGLIWLAIKYLPWLENPGSSQALALGFGFGAFEAIVIGIGALVPTLMFILAPGSLPPAVAAYVVPLDWTIMPAATVERIGTIFVHAFTTYLIAYAIRVRQMRWFWIAFGFKSAIDAFAAWGQLSFKLDSAAHIWTLEAIVIAFGAVSIWGILAMRRLWDTGAPPKST